MITGLAALVAYQALPRDAAASIAKTGAGKPVAAAAGGALATWNPSDKETNVTLSAANLTATAGTIPGGVAAGVRSTVKLASATNTKIHIEFTFGGSPFFVGLAGSAMNLSGVEPGNGWTISCALQQNGNVQVNTVLQGASGVGSFSNLDTVAMEIDRSANRVAFGIDGGAMLGDPTANTGTCFSIAGLTGDIYAFFSAETSGRSCTINAGQSAYVVAATSGYGSWTS